MSLKHSWSKEQMVLGEVGVSTLLLGDKSLLSIRRIGDKAKVVLKIGHPSDPSEDLMIYLLDDVPTKLIQRRAVDSLIGFACQLLEGFTNSMMLAVFSFINEKKLLPDGYKIDTSEVEACDAEGCVRGFVEVMNNAYRGCWECNGTGKKQPPSDDDSAREVVGY